MSRFSLLLLCLLFAPALSHALDIENAKRINRTCALCHGVYGQGTPGTLSPRLAGLPKEYLAKEIKYYRDGVRKYAPMVVASSIDRMSDKDIDDISEYLAGVDLRNLDLPKIPVYSNGDHGEGKDIFKSECRSCHHRTGLGKPKKGVPPLAGQYGSYLFSQMKKFQAKDRHHDDDPEDDTFDEWRNDVLDDIVAYLTRLPPHGPFKQRPADGRLSGMSGMGSMAGKMAIIADSANRSSGASGSPIIGRFKITPEGDILLKPTNQDMRSVAGLSGDFRVTSDGIIFFPN